MEYVLILSIIIVISSAITTILRTRIEKAIPITLISMTLTVYICGIFDNLIIGITMIKIVFILSLFLLLYKIIASIKNKKISKIIKNILTPGLLIYVLLFTVFIIYNKQRIFQNFDEFNHWAVIIKDMFINNKYRIGLNSIVEYNEYPPFTATLQYIFLQFRGVYAEDTIIIASNILYLSIIMPLLSKIRWNKSLYYLFIIIPIIVFLPTIFYEDFYINILVDGIIGILAGMIIYEIFTQKQKSDYILISAEIIALSLIKPEGILLAVCMIALIIILNLKKVKRKNIIIPIIMFILMILFVGMWYVKLEINEADLYWKQESIEKEHEETNNNIKSKYLQAFLQSNVTTGIQMTPVTIMLLLLAYNIYSYYKLKNKTKRHKYLTVVVFLYIIDVLYFIGLLLTYQYVLPEDEGQRLTSYSRYINTMIIMNIIFNLGIFIENNLKQKNINTKNILIVFICLLALFPVSNFEEKVINISNYKKQAMVNRKTYMKIQNYDDLTNEDKILYINVNNGTYAKEYKIARYLMMPIKVENMTREYMSLSADEFVEKLKQEKYTHIFIFKINDEFKNKFSKIFVDEIQNNEMYEIKQNIQVYKGDENK